MARLTQRREVSNPQHTASMTTTVVGTVDASESALGANGNCTWDRAVRARPFRRELLDAVFVVALTDVVILSAPPEETSSTGGRGPNLNGGAVEIISKKKADGEAPISGRTLYNNQDSVARAALHIVLGRVYRLTKKGIMARDAVDFTEDDVGDSADPDGHLEALGKHWMSHNYEIPCFRANGEHMGPTGPELQQHLFDGQRVRIQIEATLASTSSDGRDVYELRARRLDVLDDQTRSLMTAEGDSEC